MDDGANVFVCFCPGFNSVVFFFSRFLFSVYGLVMTSAIASAASFDTLHVPNIGDNTTPHCYCIGVAVFLSRHRVLLLPTLSSRCDQHRGHHRLGKTVNRHWASPVIWSTWLTDSNTLFGFPQYTEEMGKWILRKTRNTSV